jgi:hypothetical protein
MPFNYQRSLREPGDNRGEPPEPEKLDRTGAIVLWLVVAFVPSLVALSTFDSRSPTVSGGVLILAVACCLCSGFGVLGRTKYPETRILFGLLLAGIFFVLNVFIVIFIGCTGMGRIAP